MKSLQMMLDQNAWTDWTLAFTVAALIVATLYLGQSLAERRLARLAKQTASDFDDLFVDVLNRTAWWLLVPFALYVGSNFLTLPERPERILQSAGVITLLIQIALWGNRVIGFLLMRKVHTRIAGDAAATTTVTVLSFLLRLALWAVTLLLILDNLGFDITALVAGLGIGGIAVALAAQNVLGDLFASIAIALDKPFLIGDFVVTGEIMGHIEHIGMKTTRIRALTGEEVVIANTDLLNSRIRNYKRMTERRVTFAFGVTYQTPPDKLRAIPGHVRALIEGQPNTRFDRVHFKTLGDFALQFEAVYFVTDPEMGTYLDAQQALNLALIERFAAEGIEFAYPTQLVYTAKLAG